MIKKYFYKIIVISIIFFSAMIFTHIVFAADINVVSSSQAGMYDVMLSLSPNESINAIDGTIIFNENVTAVPNINTSNSIVSMWVKKPFVSGNSINFSGIIPGGFSVMYNQFSGETSRQGKLFSIIFPFVKNVDSYTFNLDSTYVYLNDGHGTKVAISPKDIVLLAPDHANDLSSNATPVTNNGSSSFKLRIFLIVCFILFLLACLYLIKRVYYHIHKILRK
jgi:hypothetical protein